MFLLAIVAVWRVLLMIRCVSVLCGASIWRSTVVVLLFSDLLAMLALYLVPGPIFIIMGGVRLSDSEQVILMVRIYLFLACYGTILIWLVGYLNAMFRKRPVALYRNTDGFEVANPLASKSLWCTAIACILIWVPCLFFTQPEQRLRWQAEQLIDGGDYRGLASLTKEAPFQSFPPHWDPPPRIGYGEQEPSAYEVLQGLLEGQAAPWIVKSYEEKFLANLSSFGYGIYQPDWSRALSDDELETLIELIDKLSDPKDVASRLCRSNYEDDGSLSGRRRELIERLVTIAGKQGDAKPKRDSGFPIHVE